MHSSSQTPACPHASLLLPPGSAAAWPLTLPQHRSDCLPVLGSLPILYAHGTPSAHPPPPPPHPHTQIEKVDLRDEGIYTCAATNLAGESKRDVSLKVLGEDVGARWWVIP